MNTLERNGRGQTVGQSVLERSYVAPRIHQNTVQNHTKKVEKVLMY
jgi:hypothetical protein